MNSLGDDDGGVVDTGGWSASVRPTSRRCDGKGTRSGCRRARRLSAEEGLSRLLPLVPDSSEAGHGLLVKLLWGGHGLRGCYGGDFGVAGGVGRRIGWNRSVLSIRIRGHPAHAGVSSRGARRKRSWRGPLPRSPRPGLTRRSPVRAHGHKHWPGRPSRSTERIDRHPRRRTPRQPGPESTGGRTGGPR